MVVLWLIVLERCLPGMEEVQGISLTYELSYEYQVIAECSLGGSAVACVSKPSKNLSELVTLLRLLIRLNKANRQLFP
jgi:hypothetical protein